MNKAEHKKITGFNTPAEYSAYELGRQHEQNVIADWIIKWDGNENSAMGKILRGVINKFKNETTSKG